MTVSLTPFVDRLTIPPRRVVEEPRRLVVRLEAATHQFHRDLPPSRVWSYDGSVPGPTIEVRRGVPLEVVWENRLSGPFPVVSTVAPEYEIDGVPVQCMPGRSGGRVRLSGLRGRPVILAFYPEDWSPVCSDQMSLYQEVLPEFQRYGAELLGISVDGIWCHLAFAKDRNLHFPLLSDFEPKGEVSRAYGAYRAGDGTSERALFVIDGNGVIHWSYVSPVNINPGADGILRALESLGKEDAS